VCFLERNHERRKIVRIRDRREGEEDGAARSSPNNHCHP
jgi:hypothetical protein